MTKHNMLYIILFYRMIYVSQLNYQNLFYFTKVKAAIRLVDCTSEALSELRFEIIFASKLI
ncbi:hypothetical protein [Paenisporosarcina sp. TG-14]|uniref:hypothetical protein n=1 Tax=Paenisporosarcina sp. TG-14 TaxID=1231057 RepID=UPI00178C752F|nr:hypothetical protein [Paenisporosarcina sp. TG-14]